MIERGKDGTKFFVNGVALAATIFLFDVLLPLGVVAGVPYVAVMMVGLWAPRKRYILGLAAICTAFIVVGYVSSPQGGISWIAFTNRALVVVAIWIMAILIGKHKQAEGALSDSEARLKTTLDNLLEGVILIDGKGIIHSFNRAAERMFGYTAEESVGRNVNMLIAEPERIEHDGYIRSYLETGEAKIIGRGREVTGRRKDGTTFPLNLGIAEMRLGGDRVFVGALHDISERKKAEEALLESEARFRAVVDNSPTKIHIKDAEGRYTLVNPVAEKLFGFTDDEARGKTSYDIFPKEVADAFTAHDRQVVESGEMVEKMEQFTREDGVHTYLTVKFPIPDGLGGVAGIAAIGTDITERQLTATKIAMQAALLETTFESMSQGIIVYDKGLRVTAFNQKYVDLCGYPPDFIRLGMPIEKIIRFRAERGDYGPVADTEELVRDRARARRQSETLRREQTGPDGTEVAVSRDVMPDGGYVTTFTDITEIKQAEEALRASQARLAGMLNIAPEAIISVDQNQRIQLFNKGAEAVFGYSAEEALGQSLDILLPSSFREVHRKYVEEFAGAPEVNRLMGERTELVGLRKDGTEFPAAASISKLELDNETIFTVTLQDITERRRAEEALRESEHALQERVVILEEAQRRLEQQGEDLVRLAGDLKIARDESAAANRTKSEFLANMSHELRTPLNAILGFSELMGNATLGPLGNPKYEEYTKDINDSGRHLLALIQDILDLSKIEAGKLELDEEDIDVAMTIRSCMVLVKERARNGGVTLKTDIPEGDIPEGLPALHADQRKLKQILVNLLSNAVKFTPAGGEVTLKAWSRPDSGYVFQVIDTGIGMALEDIPTALSPFGQVDSALSRKYEGTGLGLPLTKSLVEMHGGSLDLQSEEGAGTTVTVRFPKERIVAPPADATRSPAAETPSRSRNFPV